MAREGQLVVRGYTELLRSLREADRKTQRMLRDQIRTAADDVRAEARERFRPFSESSAAGYRTVVRQRGVSAEQSLKRVTGLHPEWGILQMKEAFLPALRDQGPRLIRKLEDELQRIAAAAERNGT